MGPPGNPWDPLGSPGPLLGPLGPHGVLGAPQALRGSGIIRVRKNCGPEKIGAVYVLRRTPEQIAGLSSIDGDLKDPMSEGADQPAYVEGSPRSINEEYLVVVGLCTHLGCAPKFRPEVGAADLGGDSWLGGFFCPCHGSKFDLAGRVYKGVPAAANLIIPPHSFEGENVLVVGVDTEVA